MARLKPELFHYRFQCFKNLHFQRLLRMDDGLTPPFSSIVHLINDFQTTDVIGPNIDDMDWLFGYDDTYQMFHNSALNPASFKYFDLHSDQHLKVINIGVSGDINTYRSKNSRRIHTVTNIEAIPNKNSMLNVMNHHPLLITRITGRMQEFRKFSFLLSCIFDKMVQCDDQYFHFLPFKLSGKIYSKVDFLQVFKQGFTNLTVGSETDETFFMLALLLGYALHPDLSVGPFHNLVMWDEKKKAELDPKELPKRLDISERFSIIFHDDDHACIYSLKDFVALMVQEESTGMTKFLKQLKVIIEKTNEDLIVSDVIEPTKVTDPQVIENDQKPEVVRDTSIEIPKEEEKIQEVETKRIEVIERAGKSFFKPIGGASTHGVVEVPKEIKHIVNEKAIEETKKVISKAPVPRPVPVHTVLSERAHHTDPKLHTSVFIDEVVEQHLNEVSIGYTKSQKERLLKNSRAYKSIVVDGENLEKIINSGNILLPIEDKDLSHLEGRVADPGYLKAKTIVIDDQYREKLHERNILLQALSFNRNGQYLVDVKKEVTKNKMEDFTTYTFVYESDTFKKSSMKVIIPNVRPDGTLISRGQVKKMFKQRFNKPICKTAPHRVALYSNYNKSLVQLAGPSRSSFLGRLDDLLLKKNNGKIKFKQGRIFDRDNVYPLELSLTASKYQWMELDGVNLRFLLKEVPYNEQRGMWRLNPDRSLTSALMDMNNNIEIYYKDELTKTTTLLAWISELLEVPEPPVNQWSELGVINKDIPIGIILAYRFGLTETLKMLDADYDVFPSGSRAIPKDNDTIKIKLSDVTLVVKKYPLYKSLILNGLNKFDLKGYSQLDLDDKEAYYHIFSDGKIPPSYLIEIDNIFNFFIDPDTYEALVYYKDPTTFEGILIKSTQLLTTMDHAQPSSVVNYRSRTYGKISAIMYNEMSKQLATVNRNSRGAKFSINPQAVLQRTLQDALTENADVNNPIGAIKDLTTFSYAGFGGRSSESFVLRDRVYPDDGAGVISEATVDSSNVAFRAQYSMNANIVNLGGFEEPIPIDDVDTAGLMSITGCLYPGLMTAD